MKSKTEKLDLKILYVEDEEVVRNTICEMLRRRVKDVIIAEDGAKGLEKYLLEEPPIVITDIKMPVMGGIELLNKIHEKDIQIPVILITGFPDIEIAFEAVNSEFIALCEGDDFWIDENKLQKQAELLVNSKNINICISKAISLFPDGTNLLLLCKLFLS